MNRPWAVGELQGQVGTRLTGQAGGSMESTSERGGGRAQVLSRPFEALQDLDTFADGGRPGSGGR